MENIVKRIAKKFSKNGFEIWEVGGHVRDSLIGRESHDHDLATNAHPREIKKLLNGFGSLYTVGERFGTIGLHANGVLVEVTTFRKEIYHHTSRNPTVVFGTSLEEDVARRDFTINSLARNPLTGQIVDHFKGKEDIIQRVIRCVGNDEDRFDEDPLRMLRAIRFACQLNFTLKVGISKPERIAIVSKERIRDEILKILLSTRASFGIEKMCSTGLMQYIMPEFIALKHIEQGKNHIKDAYAHSLLVLRKGSRIDHADDNLVFRLACMLHDIGKPDTKTEDDTGVHFYSHENVGARKAKKLLQRLRVEKGITARVCRLIKYHMTPIVLQREVVRGKIKRRIIMRLVRKVGERDIGLLLDLVKCDIRSSKNPRYKFMTILTRMVTECLKEHPDLMTSPINGLEIMEEFDLKPSTSVGSIKKYLTGLVVDGTLNQDDREAAFAYAREYLKNQVVAV